MYALLEGGLWSYGGAQAVWALALAAWIMATTLLSRRSARDLGLTAAGFWPSLWVVGAALLLGGVFVLAGWVNGSLRPLHSTPLWRSMLYVLWALIQEFITQSFIFVRLELVFRSRWRAVSCTALLFSAAHIPHPVLVPGTFVLAIALTWLFSRYRNLYTLAMAHAVLGLALGATLPQAWLRHMRVGIAYWL